MVVREGGSTAWGALRMGGPSGPSGQQKEELEVALKGARAGDPRLDSSAASYLPCDAGPVTHLPVLQFFHLQGLG